MPPSPNHQDDRELVRALANLFDAVGPGTRADAEDELRTAGIDPDEVGRRILQLAGELRATGQSSASAPATPAHTFTPARLAWSVAAALILSLVGWALTREVREPGGLLQQYRERVERRGQTGHDQRRAGQLPQAQNRAAAAPTNNAQAPAPTAAPPSAPGTEADFEAAVPAPDIAVDRIDAPLPRGGGISLAGEIPTGEIVTARNLEAFNASLTPGLQWAVRNGLQLRMVEPQAVRLPHVYREATEQLSDAVRLAPDGLSLRGYVAGLPFPAIDVNDPQAAVKIMWNYEYRPFATDDLEAHDFVLEGGALGENGRMSIDRRIVFETFRRLYYTGRLFVDPRPALPNPEDIRFRESLHPIREPSEFRGDGLTWTRYSDPTKADETFVYFAKERRVVRITDGQRANPLWGQDIDPDSFFGFSGRIVGMSWRLIGEGEMPACMHGENHPVKWGEGRADFVFDDVWEMRPVLIVEGVPKSPQYAYGRRVLYIDREAWVVLMSDIYDRRGELWKVWLNMFSADDTSRAVDNPAAVMIDTRRRHATRIAVPNPGTPLSTGWTFSQGEAGGITEDWFKIAHLIESGR